MDADSSYGGSDTAQDYHHNSSQDPNSSLESTLPHNAPSPDTPSHRKAGKEPEESPNTFYHKNEITLPVNYDEPDFQDDKQTPHYLSTANLNINETLENHSNLEELSKKYNSTHRLNKDTPKPKKKPTSGIDNPAFQKVNALSFLSLLYHKWNFTFF